MAILKLEILELARGLHYTDARYVHLNSDRIEAWEPRLDHPEVTEVTLASGARYLVDITADELAKALDPEGACPEPGRCGYSEYLAYRQEGQTDLSHGAYHAAVTLAEQHGRSCRVYESGRVCETCRRHEQRLRA